MARIGSFWRLLDSIRNPDGQRLGDVLKGQLSATDPVRRRELEERLEEEFQRAKGTPPEIAIVGKTGVGKSSTINSLFGTNLAVSHVEACTQEANRLRVAGSRLDGSAGDIILYDMPGLGEDIEADERHKRTYAEVISDCDVAVWVIAADERTLGVDQAMLRDVVLASNTEIVSRIVVALNRVDAIQPGHWRDLNNLPSPEQQQSIARKVDDVRTKLTRVVPGLRTEQIVPYSALRRYRLDALFEAMLYACNEKRAWVLFDRKGLADPWELASPEIQRKLKER